MINLCACMGPRLGQPYCPCEMQRRGLSDGSEYVWSPEDKERLRVALQKLSDRINSEPEEEGLYGHG